MGEKRDNIYGIAKSKMETNYTQKNIIVLIIYYGSLYTKQNEDLLSMIIMSENLIRRLSVISCNYFLFGNVTSPNDLLFGFR